MLPGSGIGTQGLGQFLDELAESKVVLDLFQRVGLGDPARWERRLLALVARLAPIGERVDAAPVTVRP